MHGKYLVVLNISKNHEYWEKKIDYDGRIRSFSYQFINLDKQEYELLKPYEKKILRKGDKLIDRNTLMFVALHEITHIMTKSIGHTEEFWRNFKFILQESVELGIYTRDEYSKNPKKYCGIEITHSPLE